MTRALLEPLGEPRLRGLLGELAERASAYRFEVAPNPCVGAAVLARDEVVARGYHEFWGGPHAEAAALEASAVPRAARDTLVVTLEPCSSTGKTPPCTELVLRSGIRRVVVGALDPDPRHAGRGLEALRRAGVEVELVEDAAPLRAVAPHFLRWLRHERVRRPRPWLVAKWAQTRSGQLSPPEDVGGGRWISSPDSLAEVQVLRGRVDAILTGVGTVRADDPRLTVREPGDPSRPPRRVVLDSELLTPPDARILAPARGADEAAGETWILCRAGASPARHRALVAAGARVVGVRPDSTGRVSLRAAHDWMWEEGVRRVLLEAGPTLQEAHLRQGFTDQLRIYTGDVNGGRGPSLASWLAPHRLRERSDRECGSDSVLEAFLGGDR